MISGPCNTEQADDELPSSKPNYSSTSSNAFGRRRGNTIQTPIPILVSDAFEPPLRQISAIVLLSLTKINTDSALAYHYAQLQALAFEEDFDPATTDLDRTKPKYHGVHKAAGEFMREWNKAIEEDERAVAGPPAKAGTKRAAINVADLKEGDLVDVRGYWLKGTMSKVGLGASTVPMSGRQGTDQMWLREVETCRSVESAVTDVQLKVAEMKDWALFNSTSSHEASDGYLRILTMYRGAAAGSCAEGGLDRSYLEAFREGRRRQEEQEVRGGVR